MVFVHAHPDDESILTAGTMRGLSQAGHRVVLVVATDGAAGLTSAELADGIAKTRAQETAVSAAALGVSATHWLGYADSGLDGAATAELPTLVSTDLETAAQRLAELLAGDDGFVAPTMLTFANGARVVLNPTAIADNDVPNAFAMGRSQKASTVCATTAIIETLEPVRRGPYGGPPFCSRLHVRHATRCRKTR